MNICPDFIDQFIITAVRSGDYYMFDDEESQNLIEVEDEDVEEDEEKGKTLGKVSFTAKSLLFVFSLTKFLNLFETEHIEYYFFRCCFDDNQCSLTFYCH